MKYNRAIVAAGSNIQPKEHLKKAEDLLGQRHRVVRASAVRETRPLGKVDQPNFLDMAFLVETELEAGSFHAALKEIETQLGRIRTPENRFGPLTIDLDILVWNGEVMDPDLYRHEFLKEGALEADPDLKLPPKEGSTD